MIMSTRPDCQTGDGALRHLAPIADFPAHRVWLLRRGDPGSAWRFAGCVLVAADEGVHVLVVVSYDSARASEQVLQASRIRCQLDRNALKCHTLDEALARSEGIKRTWIGRGWLDDAEEHV
jgi:hypothetical protein